MKKILALVLALAMVLSLVACGGSSAPAATEAPKAEAPAAAPAAPEAPAEEAKKDFGGQKIVVSMWGDNARKEMYDPIFAPFEEEFNIDVEIEVYTNAEYATKVLTEIAGGNGPDVVWLTERYYPMFVDAGVISEMNGLMTDPDYNYGDLSASLMNNYMMDGNLMSVPFSASGLAFFYNATLFKEAGLETPMELYQKGEWTVSKMLEAAKVLTKGDVKGLSLVQTVDPTNWPPMLNFFWAQGADLFTPDTSACIVNNEAGIAALQLYKDLMFTDKCCVVPGEMVTFESGKLAMYPGNASESANYQNVDFEWDYICYPTTDDGVANNVVGVASYSIMNTTKNYDAAYEVVKYVTGHAVMEQLAKTFAPPRQSIKNSDAYLNITETMPTPEGRKAVFLDIFDGNTRTYPATVNWNEINEVGKQCFDMLYTGNVSAEDVAAKLDSEINALLK